jgi:hypothetical protein
MNKKGLHYVGLDVHKKTIPAVPSVLVNWAQNEAPKKWKGGFEATVFSSWIYDTLEPYASYDVKHVQNVYYSHRIRSKPQGKNPESCLSCQSL